MSWKLITQLLSLFLALRDAFIKEQQETQETKRVTKASKSADAVNAGGGVSINKDPYNRDN